MITRLMSPWGLEWEHGYRCHGLWAGTHRVGVISLPPPHLGDGRKVVYWALDVPAVDTETGTAPNVMQAKKLVKQAYEKAYRRQFGG